MPNRVKTITVGKTRLVRSKTLQTWIKAEATVECDGDPTIEEVEDMISDIDMILDKEEVTEHERWGKIRAVAGNDSVSE